MAESKYWNATWNPVVGCTKCSPGCQNCWAEDLHTKRHKAYLAGKKMPKQYAKPFNEIQPLPERLEQPLHWRKPRTIFCCNMSDLFHPDVPFEFQCRIFDVIRRTEQHTHLVLTKRIERVLQLYRDNRNKDWPIAPNLWLGVTVCNQQEADEKIPKLLQIPAAHRWVSIEPCLGWVSLGPHFWSTTYESYDPDSPGFGEISSVERQEGIDWVVVGCESGAKQRKCDPDWIKWVVDVCRDAGVPCFVKQIHIGTPEKFKLSHNPKEWPTYLRVRQKGAK